MPKLPAIAAFATAALAACAAAPAVAETPIPGLSGHAGVIAGADKVTADFGSGVKESSSGIAYGVVAGLDYQLPGGLFVGAEAEYSDSSVSETATDIVQTGDEARVSAGGNLVLSGRFGFGLPGGVKLYARGGYSKAKFDATYDDGVITQGGPDKLTGWVAGVGAELRISRLVVRAEARHADYGTIMLAPNMSSGVSAKRNQLLAGVLYGF